MKKGKDAWVPAATIIHGYAVCQEHIVLISHRDFDFPAFIQSARSQRRAV